MRRTRVVNKWRKPSFFDPVLNIPEFSFSPQVEEPKKPKKKLKCPIHGKGCDTPAFCELDLKVKVEDRIRALREEYNG